jgi:hypothetical protein
MQILMQIFNHKLPRKLAPRLRNRVPAKFDDRLPIRVSDNLAAGNSRIVCPKYDLYVTNEQISNYYRQIRVQLVITNDQEHICRATIVTNNCSKYICR